MLPTNARRQPSFNVDPLSPRTNCSSALRGAIAIGDEAPIGATVQFHVRDAVTAGEDLHEALSDSTPAARAATGALLFTCNGRGTHLFETPNHDASVLASHIGAQVGGMFCAGEIGPVGARSYVHGFTASMALFTDGDEQ